MQLAGVGPAALALSGGADVGVHHAGCAAGSDLASNGSAGRVRASRSMGRSYVDLAVTTFIMACAASRRARMVPVESPIGLAARAAEA